MDEDTNLHDNETRSTDISERNILYDLLEITEWPEITSILVMHILLLDFAVVL